MIRKPWLEFDNSFTCVRAGTRQLVMGDKSTGYFVFCDHGMHGLTGQADDGDHCVGVFKAQSSTKRTAKGSAT